jgi:hypothetical protein
MVYPTLRPMLGQQKAVTAYQPSYRHPNRGVELRESPPLGLVSEPTAGVGDPCNQGLGPYQFVICYRICLDA